MKPKRLLSFFDRWGQPLLVVATVLIALLGIPTAIISVLSYLDNGEVEIRDNLPPEISSKAQSIEILTFEFQSQGKLLASDDVVRTGQEYRIRLFAPEHVYAYIINLDGSGNIHWIFPKPEIEKSNPLEPQKPLLLPGEKTKYSFDGIIGSEHYFICYSTNEIEGIQAIIQNFRDTQSIHYENPPQEGRSGAVVSKSNDTNVGMGMQRHAQWIIEELKKLEMSVKYFSLNHI